jgi:sigma54-dependent transcription regulator
MRGVGTDRRRFNRNIEQATRIVALALAVPVILSGAAGNPLAFAAGMGLLYFAVRGADRKPRGH